jgi:hypothetical protein
VAGRSRRIFGLALVPLLLCGLIALAGLSLLAVAGVLGEVGPAAPDLSLADRFPLAVHLLARAPALDSAAGDPAASLELVVAEGSNAQGVIDQLVESGVVHDGLLLRSYLQYRGLDVGIQAGSYSVNGSMTIRELSEALQTARPAEAVLTILEGWRLEQVGAALDLAGLSYGSPNSVGGTPAAGRARAWEVAGGAAVSRHLSAGATERAGSAGQGRARQL